MGQQEVAKNAVTLIRLACITSLPVGKTEGHKSLKAEGQSFDAYVPTGIHKDVSFLLKSRVHMTCTSSITSTRQALVGVCN